MLNVHNEKLSEQSFTSALEAAVGSWGGLRLLDFTTAESVLAGGADGQPPHYLVFIETEGGTPTEQQGNLVIRGTCLACRKSWWSVR